jgi:hypothetical protein
VSRHCHYCGSTFELTKATQRCCLRKECLEAQAASDRQRSAAHYAVNHDTIRKCQAAYQAANRDKILKRNRAAYAAHRLRVAQPNAACPVVLDPKKAERKAARHQAFLANWSNVDWSKQNCELADKTGFSQEYIRQIRQRVGAPPANHPGRQRVTAKVLQLAKDNLDRIKGLSWAEVERQYSLGSHWRSGLPHEFLKPFLRDGRLHRKHPWHLMNFRLPNSDLERIWRLPYNMAGSYRCRKKLPLPKWPVKEGRPQFSGRRQLQAYQRAAKAEEQKAARHFAQA